MKKFYKTLKTFCICSGLFICVVLMLSAPSIIESDDIMLYVALILAICIYFLIAGLLLHIYRNRVIDVVCEEDCIHVITNCREYKLNPKYFTEVTVCEGEARTFIKYDDGQFKKQFVFQMQYSPFKTYHLDIDKMKKYMLCAKFDE